MDDRIHTCKDDDVFTSIETIKLTYPSQPLPECPLRHSEPVANLPRTGLDESEKENSHYEKSRLRETSPTITPPPPYPSSRSTTL